MLGFLLACYDPPDLPPFEGVPIVAAPPEGCRDDEEDEEIVCTIDGDTFDIGTCGDGGERFRMLGIDAPETEKPGKPSECYADEAWAWLTDIAEGEDVTLSFDRTCVDVYGRSLAYVWARGDLYDDLASRPEFHFYDWTWFRDPDEPAILLNEVMLGEGLARQYPEEIAGTLIFQDRLDRAALDAEQFSRGLWGACSGR
ncbi:MAG: thermonuclease family protein [Alphaproteobacteria bacterium]|nr:thermonuclease family protein [Alphaproteobacteria bacterium]MCB9695312.1 thermonuclease family protein [Alphaproteobacteria bacterium]